MKYLSLAARYRPQTFSQVAGQDMVKAVLSRAAAESRPAAAYLLSGTRGVGKTTIARIFAKALNCEHGPGPEPCNQCAQCRKITQGNHVDVAEIDGASNNGVEDARALRETIGYAPMEGRYKVFILDEAHMLSRSAFNALLKTLEEPPERVVFIFATTEAHKFLPTIVSRCQHFVFRHLSEDALAAHLSQVLQSEGKPFEEQAVRLLARRAAGSVRDGMSLLDQVLALGGDALTAEVTRQVLGLAGQEFFADLFDALQGRDCAAVARLTGQILRQGVDIGFFVRELAGYWRNLFLLRQGGATLLLSLQLSADESTFLQNTAARFSAGHLHAAWQMTLDAQRGIVQSPEPAAALELLLLNLALLPQLLPLERLSEQHTIGPAAMPSAAPVQRHFPPEIRPEALSVPVQAPRQLSAGRERETAVADRPDAQRPSDSADDEPGPAASSVRSPAKSAERDAVPVPDRRNWLAFQEFCVGEEVAGRPAPQAHVLRGLEVSWQEDSLRLAPKAQAQFALLETQRAALEAALAAYGAGQTRLELVCPRPLRSRSELIEEFSHNPKLQDCLTILKATVADCGPVNT